MMEDGVRRSEVFRYLGYGNRVPDEETGELAEECIKSSCGYQKSGSVYGSFR